ncbi:GNAT family N-acetyltransferase [Microbacterium jiangjiandongii]|uniref:GNAT family N-acetyltransferase n=1 Tax=Microbacterium jiangjiandongii TaxID=3049071 RepID=UPI00214C88AA|nr:GNAT family N-acetyltransferase [Microbacterium sp. zg.Y843]MCR2815259.1 GNAT family N-acetyltransferase [Microbacterium sp. zg.Y843]
MIFRTFEDGAVLRAARPGDEPGILARIRDLAVYEREPDAVQNTDSALRESLFGAEPRVFAHVVERAGEIAGIAIWFLTYSTWTGRHGIWLEDLYVQEAHRGRGYGKALIASLAAVCVERGYSRLEWTVLDWNEPSIAFYRALGAQPQDEWTTQRLTGEPLRALGGRSLLAPG